MTALCYQPSAWNGGHEHQGTSVFVILDGARDARDAGLCLFPEILKADWRPVRATIEAYSATRKIEGKDAATACGLRLQKGIVWNTGVFRVKQAGGIVGQYRLDRWD